MKILFLFLLIFSNPLLAKMELCSSKIQQIEKEAKRGDAIQQYTMGILYKNGICVEENATKAINWFRLSSEAGYFLARYTLGDIYHFGEGVPIDNNSAEKYYLKILNNKNLEISTRIGNIYLIGENFEHNASAAKYFYSISAKENYRPALNNLGMMYFKGMGIDKNLTKAVEYLGKSAAMGDMNSQFYLAMSLSEIDNNIFKTEIINWLTKSAKQGFLKAQVLLGFGYIKGKDIGKDMKMAKYWIKKAKDKNSIKANELWDKHELWKY